MLNVNSCPPRLLRSAKLSLKIDGEIRIVQEKPRLNQFVTAKPALQRVLKGTAYTVNSIHGGQPTQWTAYMVDNVQGGQRT